jgi:putative acetyltransferase
VADALTDHEETPAGRERSLDALSIFGFHGYTRVMAIVVRPLLADELRLYLEIVNDAVRGLAARHYDAAAIAGWVVPPTDTVLADLETNADREIRLLAELDGRPAGVGALIAERSELLACYVRPAAARRGCGTAIVRTIEAVARTRGLAHLELAASLNAEPFYAHLGYRVVERTDITLRNGHTLAAVRMAKDLGTPPVRTD